MKDIIDRLKSCNRNFYRTAMYEKTRDYILSAFPSRQSGETKWL